jgi:hypothetical protein
LEIEAQGIGRANMLMEAALAFAKDSTITSVDLHAKTRKDGDANNVEIANELIKRARDFFSIRDEEAERIAQSAAIEAQRMLDHLASRPADKGIALAGKAQATTHATQAKAKALIAAMKTYMDITGEHFDSQTTITGSPAALSPEYAADKQRVFGFTDPIGVATGQLRENFDPSNSGNIRLRRGGLAGR